MKNKCNHIWDSVSEPISRRIYNRCMVCKKTWDGNFQDTLSILLKLTNTKAKESLIRYIVCDGEPADESCVGHPVLFADYMSSGKGWQWNESILTDIPNNNSGYYKDIHSSSNWEFAKKKPGYDYSRKV